MVTLTPGKQNNHIFKKSSNPSIWNGKKHLVLLFVAVMAVVGLISFMMVIHFKHTSPAAASTMKEEMKASNAAELDLIWKSSSLSNEVARQIVEIDKTHEKHAKLVDKMQEKRYVKKWLDNVSKNAHHNTHTLSVQDKEFTKEEPAIRRPPHQQMVEEAHQSTVKESHGSLRKTSDRFPAAKKQEEVINSQASASKNTDGHGNRSNKLHTVTYATHGGKDDRFCRAVESSIRSGYDLVILGWGAKWKGLSQKLEAAQKYADNLPDDHSILFTDAFDVMFIQSPDKLLEEYEKFDTDIIFSAECGCWPHVMEEGGRKCKSSANGGYPESPTPYRFLNSGTWIGKAGTASDMLLAVMEEAGKDFTYANDQKLVADFYMASRFGIKLDFYNKLFQSMHMTLDPPLPYCNPMDDVKITPDGTYYNKRTKSSPGVLHFNGGGKRHHLAMEGKMWYKALSHNSPQQKEQLKAHSITAPSDTNPSRKLRFDEICPLYVK